MRVIKSTSIDGNLPKVYYEGLSTETKPTTCSEGSRVTEIDTGKTYYFTAAKTWVEDKGTASGGGSGSGWTPPTVTAADNGKVMTVVNGSWDKAEAGGGGEPINAKFTLSMNAETGVITGECDKSHELLYAALSEGKVIQCRCLLPGVVDAYSTNINHFFDGNTLSITYLIFNMANETFGHINILFNNDESISVTQDIMS